MVFEKSNSYFKLVTVIFKERACDYILSSLLATPTSSTKQTSNESGLLMPCADLIPDVETLLRHLAKLHPLLKSSTTDDLKSTLPTYEAYASWPIGK